jgi:TM2 domain-containing membrane protein YozV
VKDGRPNMTVALISVLSRIALALCLSIVFNLICFGLLQWSESFLSQGVVRLLTRIVWWPVAISCGIDPRNLICALPGMVFGFLFHWLVAFGLLWWHKKSRPGGTTLGSAA